VRPAVQNPEVLSLPSGRGRGYWWQTLRVGSDGTGGTFRWVYSQAVADAAAVLGIALAEVPHHALLDVAVGLRQLLDRFLISSSRSHGSNVR